MKIASSGIGTVASAQSCNARSMFPYAWAWNAIGASYDHGASLITEPWPSAYSGQKTVIRLNRLGSFAPHAEGIKIIWPSGSYGVAGVFHDETTDATDKSGKLDASVIDFNSARYLHGVFDFSGWPGSSAFTGTTNYAADSADSVGMLQLYMVTLLEGVAMYPPAYVDCISGYEIGGGKTILVWDLGAPYAYNPNSVAEWKDFSENQPVILGATWGPTGTLATDDYIVWCGMVLSDRILTDIPLPIRTHMG